jgi:hypothetical protein
LETIALLVFAILVAFYATDTGLLLAGQNGSGQKGQSNVTTSTSGNDEKKGSLPIVDKQIQGNCLHMEYLASGMTIFQKNYRSTPKSFISFGHFTELTKNEENGSVHLSYTYSLPFKGQKATFKQTFSISETSRILDGYGLDREKSHTPGFRLNSQNPPTLDFDYPHIVNLLADSSKAIARHIQDTLKAISKTDYIHTVETVRFFVNHLPYGIPDFSVVDLPPGPEAKILKRFDFAELALTPEILVLSYGDCDSKSILMAGVLAELIGKQNIALVACLAADPSNPSGFNPHLMVGVAGLPYKKTTRISDGNTEYHLIETTVPYPNADVPSVVKDVVLHPLHQNQTALFPLT